MACADRFLEVEGRHVVELIARKLQSKMYQELDHDMVYDMKCAPRKLSGFLVV